MAEKKSILLIMPYGSVGGMERLALNFYNHYKSKGFKVKGLKFIKLKTDIINFGEDELFFKTIDFYSMSSIERYTFYLKIPFLLRKIIKKEKINYSIAFGDMANFFSSITYTKEFKVGSIHALKSVELINKTFFNSITKLGYKTTYKNLNKLVCISKAIKQDLISNCGYSFSNTEVIYNPHDVKKIELLANEPIDSEIEANIFTNPTIIFLGRLSIQKAPWHLINAFSILKKSNPSVQLVIIGDGDASVTKYILSLIDSLELKSSVHIFGRRSNPYKYIAAADVLALTSNYEGTPNVIVESIVTETPIVSSYCTEGIIELMSLKYKPENEDNIITESGIITPNFFEGTLEIPKTNRVSNKEEKFAEGLSHILNNKSFNENLLKFKSKLLSKFDLESVTKSYLTKMNF